MGGGVLCVRMCPLSYNVFLWSVGWLVVFAVVGRAGSDLMYYPEHYAVLADTLAALTRIGGEVLLVNYEQSPEHRAPSPATTFYTQLRQSGFGTHAHQPDLNQDLKTSRPVPTPMAISQ